MTMVDLGTEALAWPEINGPVFISVSSITALGQRAGVVVNCPKTGSLTHVFWKVISGGTTGIWRIRLETVDPATGNPTGTLIAAGAEVTFANPAAGNYELALDTPAAVTRDQPIAIVLDATSFSANFGRNLGHMGGVASYTTYAVNYNGTTWSRVQSSYAPTGLKIDGVWRYLHGVAPVDLSNQAVSTGTTIEAGSRMTVPFAGRVAGFWTWMTSGGPFGPYQMNLYDATSGTVLATGDPDDYLGYGGSSGYIQSRFTVPYDIEAGTDVRLALKNFSGSATIRWCSIPNSDLAVAFPGGNNTQRTQRTGAGAWTDTPLNKVAMGLLFSHLEVGGATGREKYWNGTSYVDLV